jgi:sugar (pentulose or hexulose) kinase
MYAIGIDSGTQGTKALVVDFKGRVRGRGYAPHRSLLNLKPGESEQDPQVWVEATQKALAAALAESSQFQEECHLGFRGSSTGLSSDANGWPVRRASSE